MGPCALIKANFNSVEHFHKEKARCKTKLIPLSLDPPLGMSHKDVNLYQNWNGNYRIS